MFLPLLALVASASFAPTTLAHIALWHPSMWGFNVTGNENFPGIQDNRPVAPLMGRTFEQWWFHGHMDYPPHPDDVMELPAGGTRTTELACNRAYTSYWHLSSAVEPVVNNYPCPGSPTIQFHTHGIDDLGGCALAIAYKSTASEVQPEDFTVFSINRTCVWTRDTDFQIPQAMPPCPDGKCICAWFWIHREDGGSQQNYMTAFQCNITGATNMNVPVSKGNPPRRCGQDTMAKWNADPSNCTYGARTPYYWYQAEGNNMPEGTYQPPLYNGLYGWDDGAQNDIFRNVPFGTDPASVPNPITSSPTATATATASASMPTNSSPSSTSSPPSTTSRPPSLQGDGHCLRPAPMPDQGEAQSHLALLADALGLGSLRRRRTGYLRKVSQVAHS